ncbi:MAG: hypothetical protein QM817_36130 [Archangium sp.]
MIRNFLTLATLAFTALLLVATSRPTNAPFECEKFGTLRLTHAGTCGWQTLTVTQGTDCDVTVSGMSTQLSRVTTDGGVASLTFTEPTDGGARACTATRTADAGFDVTCTCFVASAPDAGCTDSCSGTLTP